MAFGDVGDLFDFGTTLSAGGSFGDVASGVLNAGDYGLGVGGLENLPVDFGGGSNIALPDLPTGSMSTGNYNLSGADLPVLRSEGYALPDMGGGASGTGVAAGPGGTTSDRLGNYGSTMVSPNTPSPESGGGGGGGERGFWGSLSDVAKEVLPVAQVGMAGLGAAQGIYGAVQANRANQQVQQSQRQQGEIANRQMGAATEAQGYAAPIFQGGADATARAMRGEVPPGVEAQIQEWAKGARQIANSQMAHLGMGDSTSLASWNQWIDRQATAMRGAWIKDQLDYGLRSADTGRGLLNTGVAALGGAGTTTNQQGTLAQGERDSLNRLLQEANATLARLNASTSARA